MSYELLFHSDAWDEWGRLVKTVRKQFKRKRLERLEEPHIPDSRLAGRQHRYRTELRTAGYRLVYDVQDDQLIVLVVALGKRERSTVYKAAAMR